jgi:AAA family ATP:ADP antiporter
MAPASASGPRNAVVAATIAAGALVAQQVAGKATRDALFLSTFHVASLPLVMMASAVVSGAAVLAFSTALARRSPARVVPDALAAGTVLLLAEWALSLASPRLAAVAVYLHMAAFGATLVSGFWSLVNETFDPYTARRVIDRVALGASTGGVVGGLLAYGASGLVPVPAMLAVMAAFNVVCLLALSRLRAVAPASRRVDTGTGPLTGLRILREVPYLRDLALIVAFGAAAETLLDFLLGARAAQAIPPGPPLMSFFALFHATMGVLALVFQVGLSRPALARLGLAGTVALRPAAVGIGAVLGAFDPRLWAALAARGAHGVLHNSLFRSGYELLFTPLPERRKRPTKAIVDVGFDKLGALLGALAALAAVRSMGEGSGRVLFALAAACALAGLAVSRRLHTGYVAALEDSLRSGVLRLDIADVRDSTTLTTMVRAAGSGVTLARAAARGASPGDDVDDLSRTVAALRSGDAEAIRAGLRRADLSDRAVAGHLVPLLARNDVFLDVLRALRRGAPRVTGLILDSLLDPAQPVAVRRRLPRVLRGTPSPRAVDGLVEALSDTDFEVRRQSALTLARLTERAPELRAPPPSVFAAVRRELARDAATPGEDAPGTGGLAHVFTLLSLAVEREPLQIAHWALLGGDAGLRGTALEYLENVLPDDVRRALRAHLGARPTATTRAVALVRQDLLRAGDTMGLTREALKRLSPQR